MEDNIQDYENAVVEMHLRLDALGVARFRGDEAISLVDRMKILELTRQLSKTDGNDVLISKRDAE